MVLTFPAEKGLEYTLSSLVIPLLEKVVNETPLPDINMDIDALLTEYHVTITNMSIAVDLGTHNEIMLDDNQGI